jgi:tripartite-type tricarboxylate transporter receptor subunit TctC
MRLRGLVQALALGAMLLGAHGAAADDYYRGKKIFIVSSSSAGGGYDQYARLLSRHLSKHIPGAPLIIVQNMPGAEGVKAANYIYNLAQQDGTYIGALSRSLSLSKLYAHYEQAMQFDPFKLQWLGSLKRDTGILVVNAKSGLQTAEDLKKREVTLSSQAANSPNSMYARMLNALYGSKLKPIEGYEGSTAGMLAVERFEVDGHLAGGTTAPLKNKVAGWMKAGSAKPLLQFGMTRDMDYPDAPTVLDLIKDPEGRAVFELAFTEQEIGAPYVLGPKVPAAQMEMLEKAFIETARDPDFLTDAANEGAPIYMLDALAIQTKLKKAYGAPQAQIQQLRDLASVKAN